MVEVGGLAFPRGRLVKENSLANAFFTTTEKSVTTTVQVVDTVTLELNALEAQTLLDVLSFIGGDPVTSRRKFTDDIVAALQRQGLDFEEGPEDMLGAINFADLDTIFDDDNAAADQPAEQAGPNQSEAVPQTSGYAQIGDIVHGALSHFAGVGLRR